MMMYVTKHGRTCRLHSCTEAMTQSARTSLGMKLAPQSLMALVHSQPSDASQKPVR